MLKNIKTKLNDLYEWTYADTTPGLRLFGVTLVVWATIMATAHIVAYFVG